LLTYWRDRTLPRRWHVIGSCTSAGRSVRTSARSCPGLWRASPPWGLLPGANYHCAGSNLPMVGRRSVSTRPWPFGPSHKPTTVR
jgi:hypothetical protein